MLGPIRIVLAAIAMTAAFGFLASTGSSLADEPTETTAVTMTFEEPEATADDDGVAISVRMASTDGEPLARQPVEFFVTPDFLGERPVPIRTALTNAAGVAVVTYTPTWEGEHRISARYAGDDLYQPAEVTSALELSGVPTIPIPTDEHLNVLRQWATPGAIATALTVWLLLAGVAIRVGWGVWSAGRRGSPGPAGSAESLSRAAGP